MMPLLLSLFFFCSPFLEFWLSGLPFPFIDKFTLHEKVGLAHIAFSPNFIFGLVGDSSSFTDSFLGSLWFW